MGALIGSAFAALAAARWGRRRARIEHRFADARAIAARARATSDAEEMLALRDELVAFLERALEELAAQQLEANDAYSILQDYVTAQIAELERTDRAAGPRPGSLTSPRARQDLVPSASQVPSSTARSARPPRPRGP